MNKRKQELALAFFQLLKERLQEYNIQASDDEILNLGYLRMNGDELEEYLDIIGVFITEKSASYYGFNEQGITYIQKRLKEG